MQRETKIGLLVGMGVILLIGIILTDILSVPVNQTASESTAPARPAAPAPRVSAPAPGRTQPIDMPEVDPQRRAAPQPQVADHTAPIPVYRGTGDAPDTLVNRMPRPEVNDSASTGGVTFGNVPPQPAGTMGPTVIEPPAQRETAPAPADHDRPFMPRPPVAPATAVAYHTVLPGETLSIIAAEKWGDAELWPALRDANRDKISGKDTVRAGVRLVIPAKPTLAQHTAFTSVTSNDVNQLRTADNQAQRPAPAIASGSEITVASGDTLSELAQKYLGTSKRWPELLEANKDKLRDATSLRAGMKLRLPGAVIVAANRPAGAVQSNTPSPTASQAGRSYTIRPNDSLWTIAQSQLGDGGRWRDILNLNRRQIDDPEALAVGMTLALPLN